MSGLLEDLLAEVQSLREDVAANAQSSTQPEGWLNSERAADYLSTTVGGIRDLVRRNGLPHHRAPGSQRLLFRPSELDNWVARGDS